MESMKKQHKNKSQEPSREEKRREKTVKRPDKEIREKKED